MKSAMVTGFFNRGYVQFSPTLTLSMHIFHRHLAAMLVSGRRVAKSLDFEVPNLWRKSMFKGNTLLITGGTGSFGNAVLRRFLDSGLREVRIFSRSRTTCVSATTTQS